MLIAYGQEGSDVRYACGFHAVDPVVLLIEPKRRTLIVPMLEAGRAKAEAPGTRVFTPEALRIPKRQRGDLSAWALAAARGAGVRRVRVSRWFPSGMLDDLRKAGIRVGVSREPLLPERAVKREDEILKLRIVQRAAVAAMKAAVRVIASSRVGRGNFLRNRGGILTAEDVRLVIETTLLAHNAAGHDVIVAGGPQAADPHERGHGPLRAGEPIVIDIFPRHTSSGYWGDITRTVSRGWATPEVRRMYEAVKAAQLLALRKLRAGALGSSIHRDVQAFFQARGFPTSFRGGVAEGFFHGTGHGVGLDIHEGPSLGLRPVRLRRGHVVTVEPGLYYPSIGGVRIEDTVVVRADGFEYLATCPKRLVV